MKEALPDHVRQFLAAAGPEPTDLQREMEAYGREGTFDFDLEFGFPIVGPEVGGVLAILTRMVGAERILELGSGFGYSATWFLRELPDDGEIVLTELDEALVEKGREYLERAGHAGRATYEVGDALSIVERYGGPFDVVLIDIQKHQYVRAFEAARERLSPGGLVIADNMMRGPFDFEDVLAGVRGEPGEYGPEARGVVEYLERIRETPEFASTVLPVGSGVAISHLQRQR